MNWSDMLSLVWFKRENGNREKKKKIVRKGVNFKSCLT